MRFCQVLHIILQSFFLLHVFGHQLDCPSSLTKDSESRTASTITAGQKLTKKIRCDRFFGNNQPVLLEEMVNVILGEHRFQTFSKWTVDDMTIMNNYPRGINPVHQSFRKLEGSFGFTVFRHIVRNFLLRNEDILQSTEVIRKNNSWRIVGHCEVDEVDEVGEIREQVEGLPEKNTQEHVDSVDEIGAGERSSRTKRSADSPERRDNGNNEQEYPRGNDEHDHLQSFLDHYKQDHHDLINSTDSLRILTCNLGCRKDGVANLRQVAQETGCHVIAVQEPHVKKIDEEFRFTGFSGQSNLNPHPCQQSSRVVTAVTDSRITNLKRSSLISDCLVVNTLNLRGIRFTLLNVYISPNATEQIEESILLEMEQVVKTLVSQGKEVIVLGDLNAHHELWGKKTMDERGQKIDDLLSSCGLRVITGPDRLPTYQSANGTSWVDVVFASSGILIEYATLDILLSDHRPLILTVTKVDKDADLPLFKQKFNLRRADWERFHKIIGNNMDRLTSQNENGDVERMAVAIERTIVDAADQSIPRKRHVRDKGISWWNEELQKMKKQVAHLSKMVSTSRSLSDRVIILKQLSASRRQYRKMLLDRGKQSWRRFVEESSQEDHYGLYYKVIRKRIPSLQNLVPVPTNPWSSLEESSRYALHHFFPDTNDTLPSLEDIEDNCDTVDILPIHEEPDYFSKGELQHALDSQAKGKAPGEDRLPIEVIREASSSLLDIMLATFNNCLRHGIFPLTWKSAILAVVPKPGKTNLNDLKSYRPISLIKTLGKTLDFMMSSRIRWFLEANKLISNYQYGFRQQKSTIDALRRGIEFCDGYRRRNNYVLWISLDISSAFDTASHKHIVRRMVELGIPRILIRLVHSYLSGRTVKYSDGNLEESKSLTQGCPQGSIAGPLLWIILYDEVLQYMNRDTSSSLTIGFADDTQMLISCPSLEVLQWRTRVMLAKIVRKGQQLGLKFNAQKTESILIAPRGKAPIAPFQFEMLQSDCDHYVTLEAKKFMRVLGIILDDKLSFEQHLQMVKTKVNNVTRQLHSAASRRWGVHSDILVELYQRVVDPIIVYGYQLWAPRVLSLVTMKRKIESLQRGPLLLACRAFRTTSTPALCVLANVLPLHLRLTQLLEQDKPPSPFTTLERKVPPQLFVHPALIRSICYETIWNAESLPQFDSLREIWIFTDGSQIDNGTGAAFVVYDYYRHEIFLERIVLDRHSTVFQAEIIAVERSLRYVQTQRWINHVKLFSDSLSVLELLRGRQQENPIGYAIRQLLTALENRVSFCFYWTKSHVGIPGNERADILAKEASNLEELKTRSLRFLRVATDVSKRTRKTVVKDDILKRWQEEWQGERRGGWTRQLIPRINQMHPRILNYDTSQLLTGHGRFGDYLLRFNLTSNPLCFCSEQLSTPIHLFTSCHFYLPLSPITWEDIQQGHFLTQLIKDNNLEKTNNIIGQYFRRMRR